MTAYGNAINPHQFAAFIEAYLALDQQAGRRDRAASR